MKKILYTMALTILVVMAQGAIAQNKLTLLQYNVFNAGGTPEGFDHVVKVIKESGADIIAISDARPEGDNGPEGESIARKLADALGFYVFDQSNYYKADLKRTKNHPAIYANAVLSRFPIVNFSGRGYGAAVEINNKPVWVYSLNFDYKPYPPYQINGIVYENYPKIKTAEQAIKYANIAHRAAMDELEKDIAENKAMNGELLLVMGDLNEPSHHDWNEAAVKAKYHPKPVQWPTTTRLESWGLVDTYRTANPDVVAKPGFTWTPTTAEDDKEDHHDRIDFIFAKGKNLKVVSSKVIGEKPERADIVITPWVSDHRAVVSVIEY